MLNINAGHNLELLDMCPPLKGYALLVQYTRNFQANGIELKEAIGKAINQCIRENHLKSYLLKKKAEVNLMLLTEFNQEAFARAIRNEGIEEGFEKGIEKGIEEGIEKGIEDIKEDHAEFTKCEHAVINFGKKYRFQIFFWIYGCIWRIGKWNSLELEEFVADYNPDLLFCPIYPFTYMNP